MVVRRLTGPLDKVFNYAFEVTLPIEVLEGYLDEQRNFTSSHFLDILLSSEHLPQLPTVSKQEESSSETDDADREVAEMTQNVVSPEKAVKEVAAVQDRDKHKLFAEMEESIAMLLEYGQHQPLRPPRRNLPREKVNLLDPQTSFLILATSNVTSWWRCPFLHVVPLETVRSAS
ncbi:unnamed protein product [Heligmosomoides polygyrus]|uniref:Bromo domain-containing protein n=1 Tax=Heligmosomoides polygyrus TaxID=6339 RepID=A0A183FTL9_HELPZ|nr:unnamed protein product [Heligmosomoides polygyrus]